MARFSYPGHPEFVRAVADEQNCTPEVRRMAERSASLARLNSIVGQLSSRDDTPGQLADFRANAEPIVDALRVELAAAQAIVAHVNQLIGK